MKTREYTQAVKAWKAVQQQVSSVSDLMDDSISDAEFERLDGQLSALIAEEGRLYQKVQFLDGEVLQRAGAWLDGFLSSFQAGTRRITIKQAQVFQRLDAIETVNGCKTFWYKGRKYHAEMPNYRNGFSCLIVYNS